MSVSTTQLKQGLTDLLEAKQGDLGLTLSNNDATLRELHYLLTGSKGGEGNASIMEEVGNAIIRPAEHFKQAQGEDSWSQRFSLRQAQRQPIADLALPVLPASPASLPTALPSDIPEASTSAAATLPGVTPLRTAVSRSTTPASRATSPRNPHRTRLSTRPSSSAVPMSAIAPQSAEWLPTTASYRPATEPSPFTPESTPMLFETEYARDLCPLPPLPASFLAGMADKGKGKKRKIGKGDVEMSQLQAEFAVNPLSGALNRSSKCVLTADWKIAQQELRHLRVMKRVDEKQADGRWSLRQPKRHKGPAVPKAHWDWLLDEMEWLALDFKEELRWKQLLAYEFAHQIVEWHLASPEEKADMMVNERGWGPPSALGPERTVEEDIEMLVGDAQDLPDVVMDVGAGLDPSGSDVLEDMAEAEVEVKREEDVTMADADGEADADADADAEGEDEDLDADGEAEEVEEIGEGVIGLEDVDHAGDDGSDGEDETEADREEQSAIPDGRHADELAQEASRRHPALNEVAADDGRYSATFLALCPARKEVLEADLSTPFIDIDKLPLEPADQEDPSFATLFPDLDVFQGPKEPVEGVINKRHDEGTAYAGRLTHTSRLMDVRPILVSSLQPAKNREHGQWLDLHDGPYYEEPKEPCVVKAEVVGTTTTFFSGKIIRPISIHPNHAPAVPPNHQQRAAATAWTEEEDEILKKLVDIYPYNWQLISDNFNSSKVTIPTDRRSAWDCYERWKVTWGPSKGLVVAPPAEPAPPPTATSATSTVPPNTAQSVSATAATPATANGASAAASQSGQDTPVDGQNPPPPGLSKKEARLAKTNKLEGTKKYVRHMVVYDAVRRTMRRRDQTRKAQPKDQANKVVVAHESHHQYLSNNVVWTPAELAEHKYQRDLRQVEQRNQRLLQEQQRANLLRQQALQGANARHPAAAPGRPGAPAQPAQIAAMTAAAAAAANRTAAPNGQQRFTPAQVQNATQLQQMQILQAQQIAARQAQAQAQAQQAAQNGANGTPRSQPAVVAASSPFNGAQGDLPAGADGQGSPQVGMHSSPQQQAATVAGMHRPASVPLPGGQRGPGSASPQMNQSFPSGVNVANNPHIMNSLMRLNPQQQQLLQNSLAASGQSVTPEALRAFQYQLQQQQQQFQAAQAAQAAQQGQSPIPGVPQQFTRSPLAQTSQPPAKASPKPSS